MPVKKPPGDSGAGVPVGIGVNVFLVVVGFLIGVVTGAGVDSGAAGASLMPIRAVDRIVKSSSNS